MKLPPEFMSLDPETQRAALAPETALRPDLLAGASTLSARMRHYEPPRYEGAPAPQFRPGKAMQEIFAGGARYRQGGLDGLFVRRTIERDAA